MTSNMYATFLLPAEQLIKIMQDDSARPNCTATVSVRATGNGKMCVATGPTHEIMGLIGAVASAGAEGAEALYIAEQL